MKKKGNSAFTTMFFSGLMIVVIFSFSGFLCATSALTDNQDIQERIITIGKNDNKVMEHLDHLTNRIGPRLTGSDNLQNACEWALDRFSDFGLTNVHLEKCAEMPVGFNRGQSYGSLIKPVARDLHFTTPAWTAGTSGRIVARAVLGPETVDELETRRSEFEGSWIVWDPDTNRGRSEDYVKKGRELDLSIAGTIIPSQDNELLHSFGNYLIEWETLPEIPVIVLLKQEWNEIANYLSENEEVVLAFDIRNYFKKGPIPIYDVVADIPGTDLADEYVIVGAHLDSWDGATGACDNGTGVTAAMEAARILMESGARPRRTIRFILFGGHEQGLFGSKGYVTGHPELMPRISAVLNMDYGSDYISGILATETMKEDFEGIFSPVRSLNREMPFEIEKVDRLPLYSTSCCDPFTQTPSCASDNRSSEASSRGKVSLHSGCGSTRAAFCMSDQMVFLAAGVPSFMWDQSGNTPYWRCHHTQFDTYDMVVPDYHKHSATVIALGALGIADLDHMLSRENLTESPPATQTKAQNLLVQSSQEPPDPQAVDLDPKILQTYAGRYEFVPGIILSVRAEGGKLYSQLTGQQELEMYAESETYFCYALIDAQITFVKDSRGHVTHLVLHQNGIDQPATRLD